MGKIIVWIVVLLIIIDWMSGKPSNEKAEVKEEQEIKEIVKPKKVVKPKYTAPKGWTTIKVPTNNGKVHKYEVMINPVSEKDFKGNNSNKSMTNISESTAENFCMSLRNSNLIKEYIFKIALDKNKIKRPQANAKRDILMPYDEDSDEIYFIEGVTIEAIDTKTILYDWSKDKYRTTSNLFKSNNTTFRCMKIINN